MALPKLATAKYELTLPSTGQKVEFRPFLVKEEKMLMLAQQEGTDVSLIRAIQDIVDVCTFNKLDSKKLPTFDLEYVFLQLRCKSIGETANISVTCPDDMETKVSVDVNLSEVKCKKEENHKGHISANFYKLCVDATYKFKSGPFNNQIFKIISLHKNKIDILLGEIKTSIEKKKFLFSPA